MVRALARRKGQPTLSLIGASTLTIGGVVACIGTLQPWVASGTRNRNSYDIAEIVGRLGFAPDGPMGIGLRAWPLVPLMMVVAATAAWWGYHAIGALVGVVAAVYAGGVGTAVSRAPDEGLLHVLDGPRLTAVGGGLVLVGSLLTAAAALRSTHAG
jgi:hypothetical protein